MTIYTLITDDQQIAENTTKINYIEKGHLDIHPA